MAPASGQPRQLRNGTALRLQSGARDAALVLVSSSQTSMIGGGAYSLIPPLPAPQAAYGLFSSTGRLVDASGRRYHAWIAPTGRFAHRAGLLAELRFSENIIGLIV